MGTTNHGTQEITYEYFEEATAKDFNKRHLDIQPRGIYKGGYLTRVSDSEVTLSIFTAEIGDDNEQISVKTSTIVTINSGILDSGSISSGTPFLVLRWGFLEQADNYVEIHAIASVSAAQANDIIIGKCVFIGGALQTTFDYTDRTFLNVQDLLFKVEELSGLYVQLRAGRIQDGTQYIIVPEQKVGEFSLPISPNSRIDLVYINTDGTVSIKEGTQAVSPTAPDYESRLVVAEVRIVYSDSSIPADRITDVRSFLTILVSDGYGNWQSKSNNTIYQTTTDGVVYAMPATTATSCNVKGYTDGNNPPITLRQFAYFARTHSDSGHGRIGISMHVRKGDYWKVTGAAIVYWLPTGA